MATPAGIEVIETIYGTFFCWANDLISEQLKAYSAHTRNELAMLRSFLRPGDNVLDLGAHIGTFAIPLAGFIGEGGSVYAFEGNPDNYALLEKNIRANSLQERIRPVCAVVSETGNSFSKVLTAGGNSGMYYFSEARDAAGQRFSSVNVCVWLDRNAPGGPIHLIKIDIEGAEASVLRSCAEVIKRDRPVIYCEINSQALGVFKSSPAEVESILSSFGYHFFKNVGKRNSANDEYRIARLKRLKEGGPFFDVLAVHPSSERYPPEVRRLPGRLKRVIKTFRAILLP